MSVANVVLVLPVRKQLVVVNLMKNFEDQIRNNRELFDLLQDWEVLFLKPFFQPLRLDFSEKVIFIGAPPFLVMDVPKDLILHTVNLYFGLQKFTKVVVLSDVNMNS